MKNLPLSKYLWTGLYVGKAVMTIHGYEPQICAWEHIL